MSSGGSTSSASRVRSLGGSVRGALVLCWRAARWTFVASAVLQLLGAAALALQLVGIRRLLQHLLENPHGSLLHRTAGDLALVVGALALSGVALATRSAVQPLLGERISRYAIEQVLGVALRADLIRFEEPALHNRIQHSLIYAVTRPLQLASGILALLGGLGGVLGVGAALAGVSPWLVVVVVVGAVPGYLAASRTNKLVYAFSKAQVESDRRRNYLQSLSISREPAKELRGYQMETVVLDQWRAISDARLQKLTTITRKRLRIALLAALAGALVTGVAVIVLLVSVDNGTVSLAAAGAGALALLLLAGQLQTLASSTSALADSARFVADFFAFVNDGAPTHDVVATSPSRPFASLASRGVTFAYPGGPQTLHGVDLELRRGEVVALVGRNGSGKTTLAKLLCGLLEPTSGSVEWNATPFTQLNRFEVRAALTPVFQDPAHLQLRVSEYVGMGRPDADLDRTRVEHALQRADISRMTDRLTHGVDTQLGPEFMDGTELSGGQWQRLSLARALYRGGDVVVLDEPASALDPFAEAELFGNARRLFPHTAVLMISHRFGSVRTADRIYVMDDGRVVEIGDHDDLVSRGGLYARMYESQRESLLGS